MITLQQSKKKYFFEKTSAYTILLRKNNKIPNKGNANNEHQHKSFKCPKH